MEKSGSHTGKNQVARETSGNSTSWWSRKVTTRNKRQASGRTKATCSTSLRCSPEAEASHCDTAGSGSPMAGQQRDRMKHAATSSVSRATHKTPDSKGRLVDIKRQAENGLPGEGDGVHSTLAWKIPWRGAWRATVHGHEELETISQLNNNNKTLFSLES